MLRAILLASLSLLGACQRPIGDATLMRPDHVGLEGMYRASGAEIHPGDAFFVVYQDAFFKELPDVGGVSEVLLVFEFTEAASKDGKMVTVIGPSKGHVDEGYSRHVGRIVYGPKKLESDVLEVKLTAYEFDAEEQRQVEQLLKAVSGQAQIVSAIDPLTASEIRFAAEIAGFLNTFNRDDVIFEMSFDLVALPNEGAGPHAWIPMVEGPLILVEQERRQPIVGDYFYVSGQAYRRCQGQGWERRGCLDYVLSVPIDVALLVPSMVYRNLAGMPDDGSFAAPGLEGASWSLGKDVRYDAARGALMQSGKGKYDGRTWLTLAAVKGGDHAQ